MIRTLVLGILLLSVPVFAQDPMLIATLEQYFLNQRAGSITEDLLAGDSVTGEKVKDGTLTGADIRDGSLTSADISAGSLTGAEFSPGSITVDRLESLPASAIPTLNPRQVSGVALTEGTVFDGEVSGTFDSLVIDVPYVESESDPTVSGISGTWTQVVSTPAGVVTNIYTYDRGLVTGITTNGGSVF